MKRFAGLALGLLALLPWGAATADTLRVRSGEHAGFTRLVIDFTAPEDWVFGRVAGGFEFRPARSDARYRLDRIFDKIGRTRIEDVRDLGDGRLHLGVSCDCHAAVEALTNGKVVLDIVSGPARAPGAGVNADLPPLGAQSSGPDLATVETPVAEATAAEDPVFVSDRAGLPLMLPRIEPVVTGRDSAPEMPSAPLAVLAEPQPVVAEPGPDLSRDAHVTPQTAPPAAPDDPGRAQRIAETEAALLEQVARAAAQGLLDADMSELEDNVAGLTPEQVDVPPAPAVAPPSPPVTKRGHITVATSVDRAAGRDRQVDETDDGDACIDPVLFDVGTWGEEIGNGTDIGAYRSGLVTELDAADSDGVTTLIRNYIYITFGAEAKALLRRYPDNVARPDLLFVLAEIMDEGRSTRAADLADQMTCDGATALWATLAQPDLKPGQAINRDAVAIAFGALPVHLRRHLGPGLAETLLAAGDLETADLIRAALDRASDGPTSEQGMLAAQFELEAGKVDQANAILDDVVAAGDAVLPDALLQRVETTLAAGGAVPDDMVVLLDSLAFQYRGTETAARMVDAAIRARASAADFATAFEQLDAAVAAGMFAPDRSAALREQLYGRLTRDTDDTAFLRLSLPRLDDAAGLPAPARHRLARRLLDLGLAGAARAALGTGATMPDPADRQLLAQAALIENRPAAAIGYLAGLSQPAAVSLRAEALDKAGDHAGALRAYEMSGDTEKMLNMAWRGGLWPDVGALDQGPVGTAALLMVGEPALKPGVAVPAGQPADRETSEQLGDAAGDVRTPQQPDADPEGQPALAKARALIAESEAAREALGALLDEVATPDGATRSDAGAGL